MYLQKGRECFLSDVLKRDLKEGSGTVEILHNEKI
jgi:hypothetical protein